MHVIRSDIKSDTVIKIYLTNHAPRLGDEIRLGDGEYYKVTHAIWCLDEPDLPLERLNLGVAKVKRRKPNV